MSERDIEDQRGRAGAYPPDDDFSPDPSRPEDAATGEGFDEHLEGLPPRRRLRLLTPVTGVLTGLLLAALGFVAGVAVEKSRAGQAGATGSAEGGGQRGAGQGEAAGGAGQHGGAGAPAAGNRANLVGQVSSVRGRVLYVTDSQGNTIRVSVPAGGSVARMSSSRVSRIQPGDTVVVQGSRGRGGAVTAGSVRATDASLGGAGGPLAQLFGSGGGGGQTSGGGTAGAEGAGGGGGESPGGG